MNFYKVCLIIPLSFQVQPMALYMFTNIKRWGYRFITWRNKVFKPHD